MHKFFAKPLFLGKKVVFLPQCHSTNDEMVQMIKESGESEGTLVYTNDQLGGKGQRGNVWISEPDKNILMSILLRPRFLSPRDQFYLNLIVGLSIVDCIQEVLSVDVQLKWPNDVFVEGRKIAGVLIECNLRGSSLESAIVGIGLNVNQQGFRLNSATSLFIESGAEYDRTHLMESLICNLEKWYLRLKNGSKEEILEKYHELLMWRGELRKFKSINDQFEGEIIGVDNYGKLVINVAGSLKLFGIKEIEFIY